MPNNYKSPLLESVDQKTQAILQILQDKGLTKRALADRLEKNRSQVAYLLNLGKRHEHLDEILKNLDDWYGKPLTEGDTCPNCRETIPRDPDVYINEDDVWNCPSCTAHGDFLFYREGEVELLMFNEEDYYE